MHYQMRIQQLFIASFWAAFFDVNKFVFGQTPNSLTPAELPSSTQAIAYQLGILYLLLELVGAGVLYSTPEPKVARNCLIALAIGDLRHIYATYSCIGFDDFINFK
ncbi:hypothetical protein PAAG_03818 [Paracoccidioides lutzii Pb01]|uniref:DUF7704 domain-containing protein n=1 Tax=Paracoccidioides lutzii (strain ATCC MYA-826 / Pb01) TaxID=502779 RepID=C1GZ74_PARBA|nr:hypothetical protein PAAG_03818 [Paracoccidioides lutzii Pb01]EEH41897.2 hypothetical protein PAAG_03818 [Paracoccidioides lutzii Pb01]